MRELALHEVLIGIKWNDIKVIDWSKTKAIAQRANHIYINLKGRTSTGLLIRIDQYELEEEIMSALYGIMHKISGTTCGPMPLRTKTP
jgi:predicted AlkP superfamily phosphohydrolase/phosphomutase